MNDNELLEQMELLQELAYDMARTIERNQLQYEDRYALLLEKCDGLSNTLDAFTDVDTRDDDFPLGQYIIGNLNHTVAHIGC